MTARATYTAAVQAAVAMQVATVAAAQTTFQETINQSGCNVGYNLQTGSNSAFVAAVKAANIGKNPLRSTGDLGPV